MKTSDNTHISEIDRVKQPNTSTMMDRYAIASHWTKDKVVLDAATGYGYGAGILLSLGAKHVTGIDLDEDAIHDSQNRYQSHNMKFMKADIFELEKEFILADNFDVCVSLETFEHLPPERIDEYLQSIKAVTNETIVISTPRRKTPTWTYNGGTHLYEYDPFEFGTILTRNFPDADIETLGIIEVPLQQGNILQWGSALTTDWNQCWIMLAIINLKGE